MTSDKTFDWVDVLAGNLVHHAARRAPGELRERLAEEWLADMSERPRGLPRLRFALGCCWATSVITREHSAAAVPAVSAAVARVHFGGYIQMGPAYTSRRTVTFILVATLHAAVLGGLILGLTQKLKRPAPHDFQTQIIDRPRPPVERPVIAKPGLESPVLDVEPPRDVRVPEDIIETPVESDVRKAGPATSDTFPQDPPHVVNRVRGAPGAGFPSTSDYYPDSEIRRGRQGAVAVNVCVDVNGRLTSSPSLLRSSGSDILDQAALRLTKAGSGHFRPTTEDGHPVSACYGLQIQFVLK